MLHVHVVGSKEFVVGDLELDLMRGADGRRTLGELLAGEADPRALAAVRRLIRKQGLDLVA